LFVIPQRIEEICFSLASRRSTRLPKLSIPNQWRCPWFAITLVFISARGKCRTLTQNIIKFSPGPRFRAALLLAILADLLQVLVLPLFVEGAESPADDALDLVIGIALVRLLGWHWEFLPSFVAKLIPGVDLVPFWTLAVASVYRKSKRIASVAEASREDF